MSVIKWSEAFSFLLLWFIFDRTPKKMKENSNNKFDCNWTESRSRIGKRKRMRDKKNRKNTLWKATSLTLKFQTMLLGLSNGKDSTLIELHVNAPSKTKMTEKKPIIKLLQTIRFISKMWIFKIIYVVCTFLNSVMCVYVGNPF